VKTALPHKPSARWKPARIVVDGGEWPRSDALNMEASLETILCGVKVINATDSVVQSRTSDTDADHADVDHGGYALNYWQGCTRNDL
jgi:hypothetical protein